MPPLHPRTGQLRDPGLPALEVLLGPGVPDPIQAALGSKGLEVTESAPIGVTWQPGRSVTVRYQMKLAGAGLDGSHQIVAAAGRIPSGALVVGSDDFSVGVWRVPHDPQLPGFPAAVDAGRVRGLLADLGASEPEVTTRVRAYRPTQQAVVEARGAEHSIFLKVLRPRQVEQLHRHHLYLRSTLPTPETLGYSADLGILALEAMPGVTLRIALDTPQAVLPDPSEVICALENLPFPAVDLPRTRSAIDRLPEITTLLRGLLPGIAGRLDALGEVIGSDSVADLVPVHGDFYEGQVMVNQGRLAGILDVDTYGWGRPGDDLATMIGHLAVWQGLSTQPRRARRYGQDLIRLADQLLDPIDLRLRIAAVVTSLAPGPFRVLLPDWPAETERRIALAERWVESARRVDERSLIPNSHRSHLTPAG